MYVKSNETNAGTLLAELAGSIRDFNDSVDVYIDHIGEYEVFNPFLRGLTKTATKINRPIPYQFWEKLGVRHLILDTAYSRLVVPDHWCQGEGNTSCRWRNIKNEEILEELEMLFNAGSVIQFADWAGVEGASDFWDGMLYDVIIPLDKRDFQFVFRLGNVSNKLVYEIEEVFDIMGEYASYGNVTLVLDNNEADILWSKLNGISYNTAVAGTRLHEAGERYSFLFNLMNIDSLVIVYANRAILFSKEQQSQFGGRSFENIYLPGHSRDSFDAGYRLGLLLQLDTAACIALGQVVSGAYGRNESWPGSEILLNYIKDWMAEMSSDHYLSL